MKKRITRQDVIRTIIREQEMRTQRDLVNALFAKGYECTQATVSRDIKDMQLEKAKNGAYMLREDVQLKRLAADMITDVIATDAFVVVKTQSGMAQGVAAAIDNAQLNYVLGTLAGDDTILVLARTSEQISTLAAAIDDLYAGNKPALP